MVDCIVHGEAVTIFGEKERGTITFTPSFTQPLRTIDDVALLPDKEEVELIGGQFSVAIPATDDPAHEEFPWVWRVNVNFSHWKPKAFYIEAPGGTSVDLFDVSPVYSVEGYSQYVRSVNGTKPTADGNVDIIDLASGTPYIHNQTVPATVWTVDHNLGYRPSSVSVFSSDYSEQWDEFSIQHMSLNTLRIVTDVSVAGVALVK